MTPDVIDLESLSPDAPALILLCTSLGADRGAAGSRPLGPVTWSRLDEALRRNSFRGPRELIGLTADEIARSLGIEDDVAAGLARRLVRSGQLAFELDRIRSRGIWVVTIADDAYPAFLRDRLGSSAPPVLFGSGPASLLVGGGIAVVGSREADDDAVAFTARLASAAAAAGRTSVVSGGARGIDASAMRAALESGGSVVGVLPEGVERRLREPSTRSAVAGGQAVLVSPYHPSATFSAGAAMGRNKLIYALSDVAVVVSSADGTGGTWTGAVEALKGGWVPVLVRDDPGVPAGNRSLIGLGAAQLSSASVGAAITSSDLVALADSGRQVAAAAGPYLQEGMFDDPEG